MTGASWVGWSILSDTFTGFNSDVQGAFFTGPTQKVLSVWVGPVKKLPGREECLKMKIKLYLLGVSSVGDRFH